MNRFFDSRAGNGRLYTVNVITPGPVTAIQVGQTGSSTPGIFDSVMFDRTGATVFAVSANDNVLTGAALVQVSATSPFTIMSRVGIGLGNSGGACGTSNLKELFLPAL